MPGDTSFSACKLIIFSFESRIRNFVELLTFVLKYANLQVLVIWQLVPLKEVIMKVKTTVETRQKQPGLEYEGTLNVGIEERNIASIFLFQVNHPFDNQVDLMVKKGEIVFLELNGHMTDEELKALNPEQGAMCLIFTDAIMEGINALRSRLSHRFLTSVAEEFGYEVHLKAETSCIAQVEDPKLQELICTACA